MGGGVAVDLLLTGRTFNGAEAAAMGIATRTVPASDVLNHAMAVAADIAVNVAPMSAALSKRLLWDTMIGGYRPPDVAALETELHRRVMGTADAREGFAAFERPAPRWSMSVSRRWQPLPEGQFAMTPQHPDDLEDNG